MEPDAHHSVCTLADLLSNNIVIKRVLIAENHAVVMRVSHVRVVVHLLKLGLRACILHLISSLLLFLLQKLCLGGLVSGSRIVHVLSLSLLEL